MQMDVQLDFEVTIAEDRVNANEIFMAVKEACKEAAEKLAVAVLEGYQERTVETLCTSSGRVAKKGLGRHQRKGGEGEWCRYRRFKRTGYWQHDKRLRGAEADAWFRPAMVECLGCGKRFTPVLGALELEPYQGKSDELLKVVSEAIADTSYRRGSAQLDVLGDVPVPKSTAHRWAASVSLPVSKSRGDPFLGADGTGFHKQPGEKGQVRFALEIRENGTIHPLGVWAGIEWDTIARQLRSSRKSKWTLLTSDGERGIDNRIGPLAEYTGRCQWHFVRDSNYSLWQAGVPLEERKEVKHKLADLVAIEIPQDDVEFVLPDDKDDLLKQIRDAENDILALQQEFEQKGYEKAATYLANARKKLFTHLRLWIETGIVGPRTASLVENIIRELVRRLKKVGWNWSDAGAERMGRIVMIRRYDPQAWQTYWQQRMNLQNRCQITLLSCRRQWAA